MRDPHSIPIIYCAGRSYDPPHDGTAKRMKLVTSALQNLWPNNPRFVISPALPFAENRMRESGWKWISIPTSYQITPRVLRILYRLFQLFRWRWLGRGAPEALSLIGGACLRFERDLLASFPVAWIIVGRCESAGLALLRTPQQNWVLDSNDTITNLEATYGYAQQWRRCAGFNRSGWLKRLRRQELDFARVYDRVISVSEEDREFYAASIGSRSVLEDTFVVHETPPGPRLPLYDVGYIGGTHKGAVDSAKHMLQVAARRGMSDLTFAIAGSVCRKLDPGWFGPNVRCIGLVEDSTAFLQSCRTVLLLSGTETGGSVKFQEALASGSRVLANRNAARFSCARAGLTHLQVESQEEACALLQSGKAFAFVPQDLTPFFGQDAFHTRLREALGWPHQSNKK